MHTWLIQTGEPLPTDPDNPRLLRTGLLAQELVRRGHRVTWWATTFRHTLKTQRARHNTVVDVAPGYRLMLMRSPGYSSNVSLRRVLDHRILGRNFRKWARQEAQPDVIHCGFPTIETAWEAARYGAERGVPCALDARDMWPDIHVEHMPALIRPAIRVLLAADFRMTREAFRKATAITGHAPGFVDWGLAYAGRARTPRDRDFPFGYPIAPPGAPAIAAAESFWREKGLLQSGTQFLVCFFGTFAERREVDLHTVLLAARQLQSRAPGARLILCGTGPAWPRYAAMARELPNVLLPGWVDAPQIWVLMRHAHVGLLPYLPSADFRASMPNKAIEYLSAGLPILTSLSGGYLESVLNEAGCGIFYSGANPESLADMVVSLGADSAGLSARRVGASRLFAAKFRADVVHAAMAQHLEALAGRT